MLTYKYYENYPNAALNIYHKYGAKSYRAKHKTNMQDKDRLFPDFRMILYMYIVLWLRETTARIQNFGRN